MEACVDVCRHAGRQVHKQTGRQAGRQAPLQNKLAGKFFSFRNDVADKVGCWFSSSTEANFSANLSQTSQTCLTTSNPFITSFGRKCLLIDEMHGLVSVQ